MTATQKLVCTKAKLEKEFYAFVKTLPSRVGETPESAIWDFISRAIDEAAHATEKAGEVEEEKHLHSDCGDGACNCYAPDYNDAVSQSRRQLDEYFGRTITR